MLVAVSEFRNALARLHNAAVMPSPLHVGQTAMDAAVLGEVPEHAVAFVCV